MRRTWILVLAACAAWPAAANEDTAETPAQIAARKAAEKKARSAIARFKSAYRTRNEERRCNALLELSMTQHPLVIAEMDTVLKKDRADAVRQACAMVLGEMTEVAEAAGAVCKAHATERNDKRIKLLVALADSIGKLKYRDAHAELLWMLGHRDQFVVIAAIRTIAEVGDLKALPKLYDMAKYQGTGYSWETGEVSVDTGTSGDADQKAAEAAWKAKYGHVKARRVGPTVVKLYMRHLREAVEKLTGKKFKNIDEFKAWMDAHQVECGLRPPPRKRPAKK